MGSRFLGSPERLVCRTLAPGIGRRETPTPGQNLVKLVSVLATTRQYLERGEETAADLPVSESTEEKAKSVRRTLPDPAVVQRHRQAIAAETGLDPAQVRIVLDFGSFSVAL